MSDVKYGLVNHILTQSYVDGPGNRAVVFLQRCNFHCKFCHNPFTINICSNCGKCIDHCQSSALEMVEGHVVWIPENCTGCDTCIQICPYLSSPKSLKLTALAVWQAIQKNAGFISGISVSGGEPALQIPFLIELFELVKRESNLTTLIETNGSVGVGLLTPLLPLLDMAMVDLKSADPAIHKKLTTQPLEPVLQTIEFIYQNHKLHAVQQVIVPGYTDTDESIAATADLLVSIGSDIRLKLLRFRPHGTTGEARFWESPGDDRMIMLADIARSRGLKNVERSL